MLREIWVLVIAIVLFAVLGTAFAEPSPVPEGGSISGTVTSPAGSEAGVWVIAETRDLGKRFLKIVVTDDQGRFLLPDLPKAKYRVWSRGYGLVDSNKLQASPGATLELKNSVATSPAQAAQLDPANYWASLIRVPPDSEFPGTGDVGNGINPAMQSQQHWISNMVESCQYCHQLGDKASRELPTTGEPIAAWHQRILTHRLSDDRPDHPYDLRNVYNQRKKATFEQLGADRAFGMFADWTSRIAKGEVPPVPPRPVGIERDLVVTLWDIADGRFIHSSVATDRRNPTANANGPVYANITYTGMLAALDPKTGKEEDYKLLDENGKVLNSDKNKTGNHYAAIDTKGRVWMAIQNETGPTGAKPVLAKDQDFCADPSNKYVSYFPRDATGMPPVVVYEPKTKTTTAIPVCFGMHHLIFDANERLYFGSDKDVVGWVDVNVWDKTKDPASAVGWCPFVLDTNGDGKITPDRNQWNTKLDALDPSKDTLIVVGNHGLTISPKDQSFWTARSSPGLPPAIIRVETGAKPPQTCKTEYYEAPKVNGRHLAFPPKGVDIDSQGVVWVAFGSGAIGRFDRSKCKVLNGPTATGQHCPEGWEIIETPGPQYAGTNVGSNWIYGVFVDHNNTFGLGKDVPIFPNASGEELFAYIAKDKKFLHLRVPYPLGFTPFSVEGRMDDAKAGWKGRGLWATNNSVVPWHQETGQGSSNYAVHFQLRPTPLAQ
jgi:hypothetical protein